MSDKTHLHPSGEKGVFGEPRLHDGFGGLKRFAIRVKHYRCSEGHEFLSGTNHYSTIYTCPAVGCKSRQAECIELTLVHQLKQLEKADGL